MVVFVPASRFPLGEILATSTVIDRVPETEIQKAIFTHALGYVGESSEEEQAATLRAIETGARLFTAHESSDGVKFLVVTESDRSATTVLLEHEL